MSAISSLERYLEHNIRLLEKRRPLQHQSEGGPHLLLLPPPPASDMRAHAVEAGWPTAAVMNNHQSF